MSRTFPSTRLRRNRFSNFSRRLVREHTLSAADFIYPVFVIEGSNIRQPIDSMAGQYRLSLDELEREVEECLDLGIPALALFPNIDVSMKTDNGDEAHNPEGLNPRVVTALKEKYPEMELI